MRNLGIALLSAFALAFPAAAKQVTCKDGTTSDSGRGACSHHGGVDKAAKKVKKSSAKKADTKKAEVEPSTGATKDQRARNEAREPTEGTRAENKGGILGGLFGRRSDKSTPRSETRDNDAVRGNAPLAICKDGTKSYSKHHSGTCSNHGGVREWLDK